MTINMFSSITWGLILTTPGLVALSLNPPCLAVDSFFATYTTQSVQQFYLGSLRPQACRDPHQGQQFNHNQKELFYHLGGNTPWIPKKRDIISQDIQPPEGCKVEQVHMMSRHAERYPTKKAGANHLALLKRLMSTTAPLNPEFDFIANWTYFTSWTNPAFEELTSTSQNAGTLDGFSTGVKLRTRYQHLTSTDGSATQFWTAGSSRDVATARYFGDGFFGRGWETDNRAILQIIPETSDLGADTLTPGDTCYNYVHDENEGHSKGYGFLADWQNTFIPPIIKRLTHQQSDVTFTNLDIYAMMEMCGFEMLVRDGLSPWCNLFSHEDWVNFEYARDLLHFYRAGPGNRFSKAMGWLWLNATLNLLEQGPDAGKFFFSFVHDGDIIPMLSALGYPTGYDERAEEKMPSNRLILDRGYKTSDISPMGGRVIFERLECSTPEFEGTFVRLNINDGIVPLGQNSSGPGNSTSLQDLRQYLDGRQKLAGDFRTICGLDDDAPDQITFLHQ